jgi:hypothetical protein
LRIDTRTRKSLQGTIEMMDNGGNLIGQGTVRGTWASRQCAPDSPVLSLQFDAG